MARGYAKAVDVILGEIYGVFAGLHIAQGNMYEDEEGTYHIYDTPFVAFHTRGNTTNDENTNIFTYNETLPYFNSTDLIASSAVTQDVDNEGGRVSYAGFDDWRMGLYSEWQSILGEREGSTINGVSGCYMAFIAYSNETLGFTGYDYWGNSGMAILLAPDGMTMTDMPALQWQHPVNSKVQSNNLSALGYNRSTLQLYLDKGCVLIGNIGMSSYRFLTGSYYRYGGYAYYSTSQSNRGYYLGAGGTTGNCQVRLVRDAD